MSCQFVQESLSSYLDNRLTEPDRRSVALHLAECRDCATQQVRVAHDLRVCCQLAGIKVPSVEAIEAALDAAISAVARSSANGTSTTA